jgi:hypothetical protein
MRRGRNPPPLWRNYKEDEYKKDKYLFALAASILISLFTIQSA